MAHLLVPRAAQFLWTTAASEGGTAEERDWTPFLVCKVRGESDVLSVAHHLASECQRAAVAVCGVLQSVQQPASFWLDRDDAAVKKAFGNHYH